MAWGISESGQVVAGELYSAGTGAIDSRAFVWDPVHGMRDLNELLDPVSGAGWVLLSARGVNADGTLIAGNGLHNGQRRGFIVQQVIPEPSTLALFGTGTLTLLGCGWRRRRRAA
jgi:probable HAF family extracellular repeat protein